MDAQASVHPRLLREIRSFAPAQTPALLRLALDILAVESPSPLQQEEVLRLCRALANEGALVQEMAEEIARELVPR